MNLWLFDGDGNAVNATSRLLDWRVSPGTWYVRVGDHPDREHTRDPYRLEIKTLTDHGDTREDAHPIDVLTTSGGGSTFRDFHSSTDVDFYTFELEEDAYVWIYAGARTLVWTDDPFTILDVNLQVFDEAGAAMLPPSQGRGAPPPYTHGPPYELAAGTYYLRLTPYFMRTSSDDPSEGSWWIDPSQGHSFTLNVRKDADYAGFVEGCSAIESDYDDPYFGCQWHLENTASNAGPAGEDIGVVSAWAQTLGAGVNVAVVDDEVDFGHADLTANWNQALSHDYRPTNSISDPFPSHGLAVAGIIAARDNGLGIRGVAPRATIFGHNPLASANLANFVDALTRSRDVTAVYSNSWNWHETYVHLTSQLWDAALESGVSDGFGGKGSFYVFSAGNGHGLDLHVNLSEAKNHYAQTMVCAVDENGDRKSYSETGYSLWVCAPAAEVTTNLRSMYRDDFGGTSARRAGGVGRRCAGAQRQPGADVARCEADLGGVGPQERPDQHRLGDRRARVRLAVGPLLLQPRVRLRRRRRLGRGDPGRQLDEPARL